MKKLSKYNDIEDHNRSTFSNQFDEDLPITNRRNLIKGVLTTGAIGTTYTLPDKWTKPIIDSVILPAHAQTSATTLAPTTTASNGTTTTTTTTTEAPSNPSCMLSGPTTLQFTEGLNPPNVLATYTITNTGDVPLTGAISHVDLAPGPQYSVTNLTNNNLGVGNSATFDLLLTSNINPCPANNGDDFKVQVLSNETFCELTVTIICNDPPP